VSRDYYPGNHDIGIFGNLAIPLEYYVSHRFSDAIKPSSMHANLLGISAEPK